MVDIDIAGLQQDMANEIGGMAVRKAMLAGENEALKKKVAALEKELAELKKE
jgi:hypothetical protein